jgi:hypothetical protein
VHTKLPRGRVAYVANTGLSVWTLRCFDGGTRGVGAASSRLVFGDARPREWAHRSDHRDARPVTSKRLGLTSSLRCGPLPQCSSPGVLDPRWPSSHVSNQQPPDGHTVEAQASFDNNEDCHRPESTRTRLYPTQVPVPTVNVLGKQDRASRSARSMARWTMKPRTHLLSRWRAFLRSTN